MNFQFDPRKAKSNLQKHGISFADARGVFEDLLAIHIEDDYLDEERFIAIGFGGNMKLLTVVYTFRGNNIRLISARQSTKMESKNYES